MLRNQPTIKSIKAIIDGKTATSDKETTMTKTTKAKTTKKQAKAKAPKAKNPQVKAINAKAKQARAKQVKAAPKGEQVKQDAPKLKGAAYLMDKLNKRTAYIAAHADDNLKIIKATNKFTDADLCADATNAYFLSLFVKVNKCRSYKFATVKQAAKNGLKLKDGAKGVDIFYTNKNNKLAYYTVYNMRDFVKAA